MMVLVLVTRQKFTFTLYHTCTAKLITSQLSLQLVLLYSYLNPILLYTVTMIVITTSPLQRLCGALSLLLVMGGAAVVGAEESTIEYGVDVSFPIHHRKISDNFAWLPHNVDPENNPTPEEYKDMVVNPLPGREEMYADFIKTCEEAFGKKGSRCRMTEQDRIAMSLRQPQSMQVRSIFLLLWISSKRECLTNVFFLFGA